MNINADAVSQEYVMSKFASERDLRAAMVAEIVKLRKQIAATQPPQDERALKALRALVGNSEDPSIGWLGNAKTSRDHFRCEHCGVEDLDCSKIAHLPACPIPGAILVAASAPAQQAGQSWKLVPMEPNKLMLVRGENALHNSSHGDFHATEGEIEACYRAMLAASQDSAKEAK